MGDNTEIQGLEFQIIGDSVSAEASLNKLKEALVNLKTAVQGGVSGVKSTANQITALKTALEGFDNSKAQALKDIGIGLKALSDVGNVKISASIPNQITALKTALAGLDPSTTRRLANLAVALKPLSEIGKIRLTGFISQLGKLPDHIRELDKVDLTKFTNKMQELAKAVKPLADEMAKISSGFSAFSSGIKKVDSNTKQYNNAVRNATSQTTLWNKAINALSWASLYAALRRAANLIAQCIVKSNNYQEDLNLFTVALGQYAEEAQRYAEKVGDAMGIDPSQWMRAHGVFNTLLTGFGNVSDRAYIMSTNLTQLGYDLASFFNISVEDAMQKLQSGISGELEPLRRLGYDLSQARLKAVALSLGIDKAVTSMTQAEKAELRYHAIMTQVTAAHGDMARTLEAPANQIRVLNAQLEMCGRSIGNIFIPALNEILPYAIAVVQAIREIAEAIAELAGFALTEVDYSGVENLANSADNITDGFEDATDAAKKLKKATAGFDELNIISETKGDGDDISGGAGFDFELPTYDFLGDAVNERVEAIRAKLQPTVDWLKDNLEEILAGVKLIGGSFLLWKISTGLITAVKNLVDLIALLVSLDLTFPVLGLGTFLADLVELGRYLQDFSENGATFSNVAGIISEFAGLIGDAAIILGKVKLGGALKVVQGVGEIASAVADIAQNGLNWENALTVVRGLTNVAIGIELLTGNIKAAGWTIAIQGLATIIRELATNWEAIREGDWSGVDKAALIVAGIQIIGGLVIALGGFSKLKELTSIGKTSKAVNQVTDAVTSVNDSVNPMTAKLKDLAVNLGWGLLIIAEVAAAAIIIVGAIYILGEELAAVGEAWRPVIDNAGTVAIAVVTGTALLGGVGLAAYGLGTIGGTAALNIGIGTAILVELGVATGLFLAEIWAVGKGLDEIRQAWEPVLDNAPTVKKAIATGTAFLVAIGVVTAALGVATVASAGTIPVAIGIGTAILVELATAFVLFTASVVAVADEINDNLAPALDRLNPKLPDLKIHVSNFTGCMSDLASELSSYSKSMGSITWSSIVTSIQKLFAGNPLKTLAGDIDAIYVDTTNLNDKLARANPELELMVEMMTHYAELMKQLEILTNGNSVHTLSSNMYTNLKTVGEMLVTGFADGMSSKTSEVKNELNDLKTSVDSTFSDMSIASSQKWKFSLDDMTTRFDSFKTSTLNGAKDFSTKFQDVWETMWRGIGDTFVVRWNKVLNRLESGMNNAVNAANTVIRGFNIISGITGRSYGTISRISIPQISYMKDGGFVDEGQLFIAREKGAELVGTMNNRTAVANNDQIVEGIREGVYEAVVAALSGTSQKGEQIIKVFLDGKEITANVEKHQRERGVSIMGGVVYG